MRPTSSSSSGGRSSATTRKTASERCRSSSTRTGGRGSTRSGRARARSRRRSSAAPQARRIRRLRGEPRPTPTNVEITPDRTAPSSSAARSLSCSRTEPSRRSRGPFCPVWSVGQQAVLRWQSSRRRLPGMTVRDNPRAAAVRGDRRRRARGIDLLPEREDEARPRPHGGRGGFRGSRGSAAGSLAALDDIRARGLRMRPFCPFVKSYLERHPEYDDLIAA